MKELVKTRNNIWSNMQIYDPKDVRATFTVVFVYFLAFVPAADMAKEDIFLC